MIHISSFCDQTARVLVDPLNISFSLVTRCLACALAILVGIATFGAAEAISGLWRKLRCIEEKNETHEMISEWFRFFFSNGEEDIGEENDPFPSPCDQSLSLKDLRKHNFTDPLVSQKLNWVSSLKQDPIDNLPKQVLQQPSPADLITLRAVISKLKTKEKIVFQLDDHSTFVMWYHPKSLTINIQEKNDYKKGIAQNKLSIVVDNHGKITSTTINRVSDRSGQVPDLYLPQMHEALKVALKHKFSCRYSHYNPIQICVVRRGIKKIAEFHLKQFSDAIETVIRTINPSPRISVKFLEDDLSFGKAIDLGGPSRDYLNDLFEAIIHSEALSFQSIGSSSLILPRTKENYHNLQSLPELDEQEQTLYQQIGQVMMFCYESPSWDGYVIGRHFDNALFKGVLCLTAQEINTPFKDLPLSTQLKMCNMLLGAHEENGIGMDYLQKRIRWINNFHLLNDQALLEAARDLIYADCLPTELTLDDKGNEPDMDRIKSNKDSFLISLTDSVLAQQGSHGQLGVQLAPLHAIAKGMKALYDLYDNCSSVDVLNLLDLLNSYELVSDKIQGSLDRECIANQIKPSFYLRLSEESEIQKKMQWLQEWIKDEKNGATQEEVKNFLKFFTGSSGLAKDQCIYVQVQSLRPFTPVPIAHTCSPSIELAAEPSSYGSEYNDHTKMGFIKSLKEIALRNLSDYQMK